MKTDRHTGIWDEGWSELKKALDDEEAKELAPLLHSLEENKIEQQKLKKRIADIKERYRKKRKESGGFLFLR